MPDKLKEVMIPQIIHQEASDEDFGDSNMERSGSESSVDSVNDESKVASRRATDEEKQQKQEFSQQQLEDELLRYIADGDVERFQRLSNKCKSSSLLQAILTFSYINKPPKDDSSGLNLAASANSQFQKPRNTEASRRQSISAKSISGHSVTSPVGQRHALSPSPSFHQLQYFQFDQEIQEVAAELLGTSLTPLSLLHIALLVGEEAIAHEILKYVYAQTTRKGQKLPLMEFLNRVWGNGNSALHLASFQGMSDVVDQLLKCGANPHKRNEKGYKPVDCADDDKTRRLFRLAIEMMRLSGNESALKRQGSIMTRIGAHPKLEKNESSPAVLQSPASPVAADNQLSGAQSDKNSNASQSSLDPATSSQSQIRSAGLQSSNLLDAQPLDSQTHKPFRSDSLQSQVPSSMLKSSVKRDSKGSNKRKQTIGWNQNALLLDYCKNGETQSVQELMKNFQISTVTDSQVNVHSPVANDNVILYINRPNGQGLTPLHFACAYGNTEICELLVSHGANCNARDREGFTPLHALVAEIPLVPAGTSNSGPDFEQKQAALVEKRKRYLKFLQTWIMRPQVDISIFTEEGDSLLDMVREDDDGTFDDEVQAIILKAAQARGVDFDVLQQQYDNSLSPVSADVNETGDAIKKLTFLPAPLQQTDTAIDQNKTVVQDKSVQSSTKKPAPVNLQSIKVQSVTGEDQSKTLQFQTPGEIKVEYFAAMPENSSLSQMSSIQSSMAMPSQLNATPVANNEEAKASLTKQPARTSVSMANNFSQPSSIGVTKKPIQQPSLSSPPSYTGSSGTLPRQGAKLSNVEIAPRALPEVAVKSSDESAVVIEQSNLLPSQLRAQRILGQQPPIVAPSTGSKSPGRFTTKKL